MKFSISDHSERAKRSKKKANVEIQMKTANRNDWLLFPLWPSPSLHRRHTLGKYATKVLVKSWMLDLIVSSVMIFLNIIWGTKVRGTKGPSKEVGDFFQIFVVFSKT